MQYQSLRSLLPTVLVPEPANADDEYVSDSSCADGSVSAELEGSASLPPPQTPECADVVEILESVLSSCQEAFPSIDLAFLKLYLRNARRCWKDLWMRSPQRSRDRFQVVLSRKNGRSRSYVFMSPADGSDRAKVSNSAQVLSRTVITVPIEIVSKWRTKDHGRSRDEREPAIRAPRPPLKVRKDFGTLSLGYLSKRSERSASGSYGGSKDMYTEEEVKSWTSAKLRAWSQRHVNPNMFYYRFTDPGVEQLTSKFTQDEHKAFMARYKEFKGRKWHVGSAWGIFSLALPYRVGYQVSNYYRSLLRQGMLRDPTYGFDENGELHQMYPDRVDPSERNAELEEEEFRMAVWSTPAVKTIEERVDAWVLKYHGQQWSTESAGAIRSTSGPRVRRRWAKGADVDSDGDADADADADGGANAAVNAVVDDVYDDDFNAGAASNIANARGNRGDSRRSIASPGRRVSLFPRVRRHATPERGASTSKRHSRSEYIDRMLRKQPGSDESPRKVPKESQRKGDDFEARRNRVEDIVGRLYQADDGADSSMENEPEEMKLRVRKTHTIRHVQLASAGVDSERNLPLPIVDIFEAIHLPSERASDFQPWNAEFQPSKIGALNFAELSNEVLCALQSQNCATVPITLGDLPWSCPDSPRKTRGIASAHYVETLEPVMLRILNLHTSSALVECVQLVGSYPWPVAMDVSILQEGFHDWYTLFASIPLAFTWRQMSVWMVKRLWEIARVAFEVTVGALELNRIPSDVMNISKNDAGQLLLQAHTVSVLAAQWYILDVCSIVCELADRCPESGHLEGHPFIEFAQSIIRLGVVHSVIFSRRFPTVGVAGLLPSSVVFKRTASSTLAGLERLQPSFLAVHRKIQVLCDTFPHVFGSFWTVFNEVFGDQHKAPDGVVFHDLATVAHDATPPFEVVYSKEGLSLDEELYLLSLEVLRYRCVTVTDSCLPFCADATGVVLRTPANWIFLSDLVKRAATSLRSSLNSDSEPPVLGASRGLSLQPFMHIVRVVREFAGVWGDSGEIFSDIWKEVNRVSGMMPRGLKDDVAIPEALVAIVMENEESDVRRTCARMWSLLRRRVECSVWDLWECVLQLYCGTLSKLQPGDSRRLNIVSFLMTYVPSRFQTVSSEMLPISGAEDGSKLLELWRGLSVFLVSYRFVESNKRALLFRRFAASVERARVGSSGISLICTVCGITAVVDIQSCSSEKLPDSFRVWVETVGKAVAIAKELSHCRSVDENSRTEKTILKSLNRSLRTMTGILQSSTLPFSIVAPMCETLDLSSCRFLCGIDSPEYCVSQAALLELVQSIANRCLELRAEGNTASSVIQGMTSDPASGSSDPNNLFDEFDEIDFSAVDFTSLEAKSNSTRAVSETVQINSALTALARNTMGIVQDALASTLRRVGNARNDRATRDAMSSVSTIGTLYGCFMGIGAVGETELLEYIHGVGELTLQKCSEVVVALFESLVPVYSSLQDTAACLPFSKFSSRQILLKMWFTLYHTRSIVSYSKALKGVGMFRGETPVLDKALETGLGFVQKRTEIFAELVVCLWALVRDGGIAFIVFDDVITYLWTCIRNSACSELEVTCRFVYSTVGVLLRDVAAVAYHQGASQRGMLPRLISNFFERRASGVQGMAQAMHLSDLLECLSMLDYQHDQYIRRILQDIWRNYFESISRVQQNRLEDYRIIASIVRVMTNGSQTGDSQTLMRRCRFRKYLLVEYLRKYLGAFGDVSILPAAKSSLDVLLLLFRFVKSGLGSHLQTSLRALTADAEAHACDVSSSCAWTAQFLEEYLSIPSILQTGSCAVDLAQWKAVGPQTIQALLSVAEIQSYASVTRWSCSSFRLPISIDDMLVKLVHILASFIEYGTRTMRYAGRPGRGGRNVCPSSEYEGCSGSSRYFGGDYVAAVNGMASLLQMPVDAGSNALQPHQERHALVGLQSDLSVLSLKRTLQAISVLLRTGSPAVLWRVEVLYRTACKRLLLFLKEEKRVELWRSFEDSFVEYGVERSGCLRAQVAGAYSLSSRAPDTNSRKRVPNCLTMGML